MLNQDGRNKDGRNNGCFSAALIGQFGQEAWFQSVRNLASTWQEFILLKSPRKISKWLSLYNVGISKFSWACVAEVDQKTNRVDRISKVDRRNNQAIKESMDYEGGSIKRNENYFLISSDSWLLLWFLSSRLLPFLSTDTCVSSRGSPGLPSSSQVFSLVFRWILGLCSSH